jgi:hypothetical protein
MFLAFLAAALAGQLPTPQSPPVPISYTPAAAAAPSQTFLLLTQAPPAVPVGPSVLISSPPCWDRALAAVGQCLTARAARHQHPRAAQIIIVTPAAVAAAAPQAVMIGTVPRVVVPAPSAQTQTVDAGVPPPPFVLSVEPTQYRAR